MYMKMWKDSMTIFKTIDDDRHGKIVFGDFNAKIFERKNTVNSRSMDVTEEVHKTPD